jgi:hypothetical protein
VAETTRTEESPNCFLHERVLHGSFDLAIAACNANEPSASYPGGWFGGAPGHTPPQIRGGVTPQQGNMTDVSRPARRVRLGRTPAIRERLGVKHGCGLHERLPSCSATSG